MNTGPWYGTTGVGADLYTAAEDAVRAMIDYITGRSGLSPEDAYILSSLAVDLRIPEIVDAGQYVVSALLPLSILAADQRGGYGHESRLSAQGLTPGVVITQ